MEYIVCDKKFLSLTKPKVLKATDDTSANLNLMWSNNPASIYLLKVNNRNTRTRCETYSKLTIKIPERRQETIKSKLIKAENEVAYF